MVIHLTITITVVEANNLMAEANNLMVEAKIPVLIVSKVEAILLKLTVKLKKIKKGSTLEILSTGIWS